MTLTELTSIISTANQKTITSWLKELGYIDCKKHQQYKHIGLTDLFLGNDIETAEYSTQTTHNVIRAVYSRKLKAMNRLSLCLLT